MEVKTSIASAAYPAPPVSFTSRPPPGSEAISRHFCTGSRSVSDSPSPLMYAVTIAALPSGEQIGPTNGR